MKKKILFTGMLFLLVVNNVFALQQTQGQKFNNFNKGDFLISFDGGAFWVAGGDLTSKEDEVLNPKTEFLYEDGSTQTTKLEYLGVKFGLTLEKLVSDRIGLIFGFSKNSLEREIKVGGDAYEEKTIAKDTGYLKFNDLFVGAKWYFYKNQNYNFSLISKIGLIRGGKYKDRYQYDKYEEKHGLYLDQDTNDWKYGDYIEKVGTTEVEKNVTFDGYSAGLGLGSTYVCKNNIFFGSNVMFTLNKLDFKEPIFSDLPQATNSSDFMSFEWNFYVGIKL